MEKNLTLTAYMLNFGAFKEVYQFKHFSFIGTGEALPGGPLVTTENNHELCPVSR